MISCSTSRKLLFFSSNLHFVLLLPNAMVILCCLLPNIECRMMNSFVCVMSSRIIKFKTCLFETSWSSNSASLYLAQCLIFQGFRPTSCLRLLARHPGVLLIHKTLNYQVCSLVRPMKSCTFSMRLMQSRLPCSYTDYRKSCIFKYPFQQHWSRVMEKQWR